MCHLLLMMPVLALPVFWLTPLELAVPGYLFVLMLSVLLYLQVTGAMRRPVKDGFQSMVGTGAEVASRLEFSGGLRKYLVRSQGELWTAWSGDELQPGEEANVVETRGVGVLIERVRKPEQESTEKACLPE